MPSVWIDFDELKIKCSMPEVLEVFGIAHQFQNRNGTLAGACPLPQHEHGPMPNKEQFKINCKDGVWVWHCFGDCSCGGSVITFVQKMTGYSMAHTRLWFHQHFGERLTAKKPKRPRRSSGGGAKKETREVIQQDCPSRVSDIESTANVADAPPPLKPLSFFLNLDPDVPYLEERGVTSAIVERFQIGLCRRGIFDGYVAIPLFTWPQAPDTNPVAYMGRWPGQDFDDADGRPRYKVPDDFPVSRIVYGLGPALKSTSDTMPLIVVEGPFKVYHLVEAGFESAVSTLTSSVSDEQAEILAETGRRIVLLFDGNEAGYEGMRRGAGRLVTKSYVRVVKLPEGTEPDDLNSRQLNELLHFV